MSERGEDLSSVRERTSYGDHLFCFWVLTSAIGAHSISEEVAGFYSLWFTRGNYLCLLHLVFIAVHVILSVKDPKIMLA